MRLAVEALTSIDKNTTEKQVRESVEHLDREWDKRTAGLEKIGDPAPNEPGAPNLSQPVSLQTNRMSAAAGSVR